MLPRNEYLEVSSWVPIINYRYTQLHSQSNNSPERSVKLCKKRLSLSKKDQND